ESNFEYTTELLSKINGNAIKKSNLINEIAMLIIAVGSVVAFILDNIFVGVSLIVVFVALAVSLVLTAKAIITSNKRLVGQKVKIVFSEVDMHMMGLIGDTALYNADFEYKAIKKSEVKQDLIYVYFDNHSVIIVPKNSFKTSEDCKKVIELVSNNYVV
ncbi:MAG: YcxB family protein, partial [Clostridia bacterium]|nr:YcxB family protein [Clostridia bacterium]